MAASETTGLEALLTYADELRDAVTTMLEDASSDDTTPSDELLVNGRAVAMAIQELGARVEILTLAVAEAVEAIPELVDTLRELLEDSES